MERSLNARWAYLNRVTNDPNNTRLESESFAKSIPRERNYILYATNTPIEAQILSLLYMVRRILVAW